MSQASPRDSVVYFDFLGTLARFEGGSLRVPPEAQELVRGGGVSRRGVLANLPPRLGRDDVWGVLAEAGLETAFDPALLLVTGPLGFPLPDARAFGMAAGVAGCAAARCVFVSSDARARIGAAAAGWATVGVPALAEPRPTVRRPKPRGDEAVFFAEEKPEVTAPAAPPGVRYVLRGRVVSMNRAAEVLDRGAVLVESGRIKAVIPNGADLPAEFASAPEIETSGTIYPGLIDLHNHFVYNVLPLWVVPKRYDNRSQWPRHAEYRSGVSKPIRNALGRFTASAESIVRYVETKALLSGTTTGQGILTRVEGGARLFTGAMRNVERPTDDRLPAARTRVPDLTVTGAGGPARIESFRRSLAATREAGSGYFYHLAEGIDDSARRHFFNLLNNDLIQPSLVGIHALGLTRSDLEVLAERGSRIVWSPFSNQLLYGRTLDLNDVVASGVQMSLGCDWSPSGSKNLLQELKVAAFVNQEQGAPLSAERLVRLVTSEAAEVTGWHHAVGVLKPGAEADFLVIRGTEGDPYEHLIAATESDVAMVAIGGVARYGDHALVKKLHFGPSTDLEGLDVDGAEKALSLRSPDSPINHLSFRRARTILYEAMDDLEAFVAEQEAAEEELLSLGVTLPQRFVLELDNEFAPDDDPLLELDPGEAGAELLADVDMQKSIPLDDPTVPKAASDYWDRIQQQKNIPAGLKAALMAAYGVE